GRGGSPGVSANPSAGTRLPAARGDPPRPGATAHPVGSGMGCTSSGGGRAPRRCGAGEGSGAPSTVPAEGSVGERKARVNWVGVHPPGGTGGIGAQGVAGTVEAEAT